MAWHWRQTMATVIRGAAPGLFESRRSVRLGTLGNPPRLQGDGILPARFLPLMALAALETSSGETGCVVQAWETGGGVVEYGRACFET